MQAREPGLQVGQQTHRGNDFPLPAERLHLPLRARRDHVGILEPAAGHEVARHRQHGEQDRADQPEIAELGMQQPDQPERDRQPWRVEDRRQRRPGQRLAQLGQVAQALARIARLGTGGEQHRRQAGTEPGRQPRQYGGAHGLQQAQRRQSERQ